MQAQNKTAEADTLPLRSVARTIGPLQASAPLPEEGTQQSLRLTLLCIQVEWLLFHISMVGRQTPHHCFPMWLVKQMKTFGYAYTLHFSL